MNDSTHHSYTLEIMAELTGVSTQTIVHYQEHGLIKSDFDDETVRAFNRIEHLRESCEMNLHGLKLVTSMLEELERLREELRARNRNGLP